MSEHISLQDCSANEKVSSSPGYNAAPRTAGRTAGRPEAAPAVSFAAPRPDARPEGWSSLLCTVFVLLKDDNGQIKSDFHVLFVESLMNW